MCHSARDWEWFTDCVGRRECIDCLPDPESLLRFYASVDKLVSLRFHATIPALSLGARVCSLATDTRTMTVDEFGVESIPFTALQAPTFRPAFQPAQQEPDATASIAALAIDRDDDTGVEPFGDANRDILRMSESAEK